MTERLQHRDPALLRFTARVETLREGGREVVLHRTAFHPTSGGQPHDIGFLSGARVVEVVEEGDVVVHRLDAPLAVPPGGEAEGEVDAHRRLDLSQQHSGQHLLSALFADGFGLETVSVHLGETASTLELATDTLDPTVVEAVGLRANQAVAESRPVRVELEDADEAAARGLRKPTARRGPIRVVSIEGLDRSACGGTHVASTAAIGPVLLGATERIRGHVRVSFLCGYRALARARRDGESLAEVARTLGTTVEEVPQRVTAIRDRLKEAESAARRLQGEVAGLRTRALHGESLADNGLRRILLRDPPGGMDELQSLGQALSDLPGAILVGVVTAPPGLLLATTADSGIHAGDALREALGAVGGRGGGSPRVARGTAPDAAGLEVAAGYLLQPGSGG